jgi:fermentation-respiration switch protein FrsA (DUF1100 family)
MLGHGGSSSKASARNERLGNALASRGIAALAIDGPFHGDRGAAADHASDYQHRMIELGVASVIELMVIDWLTALEAAHETAGVDRNRCGYIGLSLGSRFGIPLAAEMGQRLRCAVFGKFGLEQSTRLPRELATTELIEGAARRIEAPLLLHVQRGDELFPFNGALSLFDAFGSPDKALILRPGAHADSYASDEQTWIDFVATRLATTVSADTECR